MKQFEETIGRLSRLMDQEKDQRIRKQYRDAMRTLQRQLELRGE